MTRGREEGGGRAAARRAAGDSGSGARAASPDTGITGGAGLLGAADVGNTNTVLGLYDGVGVPDVEAKLFRDWRMRTDARMTAGELARVILGLLGRYAGDVTGISALRRNSMACVALPTCGLMHGGVDLNNYQLDAEHAIDELLAPDVAAQAREDAGGLGPVRGPLAVEVRQQGEPTRPRCAREGESVELVVVDAEQPADGLGHLGGVQRADEREVAAGGVREPGDDPRRVGDGLVE